jgi:hypothetical protein
MKPQPLVRHQSALTRQFYRGLQKRLMQLRPMRTTAEKLIKPSLQLHDRLGDRGCAFAVQYQPTLAADSTQQGQLNRVTHPCAKLMLVSGVLGKATTMAALVPAWRSARMQPMSALRSLLPERRSKGMLDQTRSRRRKNCG